MRCFNKNNGFTLIELIVVISLISIMLSFALPRFQRSVFSDDSTLVSRWIMVKIPALKERALREQKRYTLHVGFDSNKLWVTHESMSEEESQDAEQKGSAIAENLRLMDVEFMNSQTISQGRADIHFYKKGYSDKALIHIEDDDNNRKTFIIEPFLSKVKLVDKYAGFEG